MDTMDRLSELIAKTEKLLDQLKSTFEFHYKPSFQISSKTTTNSSHHLSPQHHHFPSLPSPFLSLFSDYS